MQLSPHFTLRELTRSDTAARLGMTNMPDETGIARLTMVAHYVLEPVRDRFGPTRVNCGYRDPAVNARVPGAAKKSQHMECWAVDFETVNASNDEVAAWIAAGNLPHGFDQLIREFRVPGVPSSGWVHCSWTDARLRHSILTAARQGGRTVYLPGLVLK